jgi:taurine dioxygenase
MKALARITVSLTDGWRHESYPAQDHALSPTIGAEISRIDLAQPLDAETRADLHRALLKHKIIFSGSEHHARTARHIEIHPYPPRQEHPEG